MASGGRFGAAGSWLAVSVGWHLTLTLKRRMIPTKRGKIEMPLKSGSLKSGYPDGWLFLPGRVSAAAGGGSAGDGTQV